MSTISTHILDTALGKPAPGVAMLLEQHGAQGWVTCARGITDNDGRLKDLTPEPLAPGQYRLTAAIWRILPRRRTRNVVRQCAN